METTNGSIIDSKIDLLITFFTSVFTKEDLSKLPNLTLIFIEIKNPYWQIY